MELRELTYLSIALRILAAVVIGGILGLERELKSRPAGFRTYILVCVGSCLIMLTNQFIFQACGTGDPTRMGAQVVSGIGFLGAGTIIVTRRSQIRGLTTAAGLWAVAGVGLALGIGFYEAAIVGAAAIFGVIAILQGFDRQMHRKSRIIEVYMECGPTLPLGDLLRATREMDLELSDLQREKESEADAGNRAYVATLKTRKRTNHQTILEDLSRIPGIEFLEEL